MSINITYTCDSCGASQPTNEQMWNVEVRFEHARSNPSVHGLRWAAPINQALWCRKCALKFQLLPEQPAPEVAAAPITMEDIVREICEDVVSSAQESR